MLLANRFVPLLWCCWRRLVNILLFHSLMDIGSIALVCWRPFCG